MPAVEGDFYDPPEPLPPGEPGDPIWVEALVAPEGVDAWKVLYRSQGVRGEPIAVSGWVARSPRPGPHRVLAFGHGTTGLADRCAPTMTGGATSFQFAEYLDAGWTVAVTDYQGLGTPGVHHYLVAEAAARSLLDAARAAQRLDPAATGEVALLGFSQGGHAVLSAAELAPHLASELTIVGTVAAAPAILLREWMEEAPPAQIGYLAMIAAGYADAYGLPLDSWLTAEGLAVAAVLETGCELDILSVFAAVGPGALATDAAAGTPQGDALAANEPGRAAITGPVLLVSGGQDDLLTPDLVPDFVDRMCRAGTRVDTLHLAEATHVQLGSLARPEALAWLEGVPAAAVRRDACR
jgi:pimeloyl-ACP methyl ester carboxylesterase